LTGLTVTQLTPTSARVTFTAPTLPIGQTASTVNLTFTARNSAGVLSTAVNTTVTIRPIPDGILITSATYRTSKQRLTITATSTVVNANVVLSLQPYLTDAGTIFNPATLGTTFTNLGNGAYTIILVGAPRPACNPGGAFATPCASAPLTVASNIGGLSGPAALSVIRAN